MANASRAWATSASAAWAFRSASLRSTRPAPACRRSYAADHARRRHEQSGAARRSAVSGLRQHARARRTSTTPSSTNSSRPCRTLYPKCCLQWEDFANFNAVPILARYRDKICTYNDDIQGTAAVALAGIFGALRISKQKLADQRFLFLGGGSAATGIAELISEAMALEGMHDRAGRGRNWLFDVNGLMVDVRARTWPISRSRSPMIARRSAPSSRRSRRCSRPPSSASARCRNCSTSR